MVSIQVRYAPRTSRAGPSAWSTPSWRNKQRLQIDSTEARSWETSTKVVPLSRTSRMRFRQRCWKAASPTASTSSTSSTAGSRNAITANPRRICMPLE